MAQAVIGTAGHVDHGKSALVLALTGIDPDRLAEEKARGITIDLGFAHTQEQNTQLSFVDVPGHERFVHNMLAGVGGIDGVMLVVAADKSVMPQTREHFEICRLLRVPAGLVVVTKADLVDRETLDVVRLEIQELVRHSFLDGAPVVAVSARTGEGLPGLRQALVTLAAGVPRRRVEGPARLPIDRVFAMKGFGTVVTGTLVSGTIEPEQELVLLPSGLAVRVRGVQVHGAFCAHASAGQRVAVNLAGVDVQAVGRGETLAEPDSVVVTRHADVRIEILPSAKALRHGTRVRFHQGTREAIGRAVVASGTQVEPGRRGWVRVHFESPMVLRRGDRFIVRMYSPVDTIGGGVVLDPLPPRRGVRTAAGLERLAKLDDIGSRSLVPAATILEEAGLGGCPVAQFDARTADPTADEPPSMALEREGRATMFGPVLVATACLHEARRRVLAIVAEHQAQHPLDGGVPREELRSRAFGSAPVAVFERVMLDLATGGQLVDGGRVVLAGRGPSLPASDVRLRDSILAILTGAGFTPPTRNVLAAEAPGDRSRVEQVLSFMIRQRQLVAVGDFVYTDATIAALKNDLQALRQESQTVGIDVGFFKARYQMTRKHAIPLLEFLDRERVTERVGDLRRLR